MLAPDDRAVLREQLRPEPGASFDVGIATTFTLDLTAALVAPLAFAAHDVRQSSDPVAVLEAVRSVTDRLDIFCQVGQIKVPKTASDLMAFLEPMVHEVEAPAPGYLFHPKIWVVRYREVDGEPSYRLLCCTRNITDDVSWDAFVRLDGWAGGRRPLASNRPLFDLVDALRAMAVRNLPSERADRITNLAEELRRVEWAPPDGMRDVTFHALGLRRGRSRPEVLDVLEGRQHLVVWPFLDDEGVAAATSDGQRSTLVSRPEALDRLDPSTLDGLDCRVISPLAGLDQPDDEAGAEVDLSASEPREASLLGGRAPRPRGRVPRGAVEAGLAPRALQVGQTGTTVHPVLYVACISGALQHAVGMRTARTVLAVNRDPDAFIFRLAHFGIVADVRDALPQLTAALRGRADGRGRGPSGPAPKAP